MTNKRKVTVKINNQEYTVVGEESEEYIQTIASYVDIEMKRILEGNNRLSPFMAAVFSAFNFADKHNRVNNELNDLKENVVKPLEELETLSKELEKTEKVVKEISTQRDEYKDELLKLRAEVEHMKKKNRQQEQGLKLKEEELENSQKIISELQNKLFENQIELVQTKKELGEFLKVFENKNP